MMMHTSRDRRRAWQPKRNGSARAESGKGEPKESWSEYNTVCKDLKQDLAIGTEADCNFGASVLRGHFALSVRGLLMVFASSFLIIPCTSKFFRSVVMMLVLLQSSMLS